MNIYHLDNHWGGLDIKIYNKAIVIKRTDPGKQKKIISPEEEFSTEMGIL